jgi:hypothetical protein
MKTFVAAALAVLAVAQADAAETLDQSYRALFGAGSFSSGTGTFRRAQVVTAGRSGIMNRIDIQALGTDFTGFNILSVHNGVPTQTVIGTATYQSSAFGFATFSTSLRLAQGQQIALEPIGSGGWFFDEVGNYAGGAPAFVNTPAGVNQFTPTNFDYGFRTYFDTATLLGPLTLDQAFVVSGTVSVGSLSNGTGEFRRLQVVTAGKTGILGRIDIQSFARQFGEFKIIAVENGVLTTTVLGTASYVSYSDGFASFASSLLVTEGQQFALEPISPGSWESAARGGYAGGGEIFLNTRISPDFQQTGADLGFRTFMAPSPAVPEPATWAMMVMGFGLVGAGLRHRKAAAQPALG